MTLLPKKQTTAFNIVDINIISDFPPASGGVIVLEGNRHYRLNSVIVTSNRFFIPIGASLKMSSSITGSIILVYTGTDFIFTGVDFSLLELKSIALSAPAGAYYNFDSTGINNGIHTNFEVLHLSCANQSILNNNRNIFTNGTYQSYGGGLLLSDGTGGTRRSLFSMSSMVIEDGKNSASTFLKVEGNIANINVQSLLLDMKANETAFDFDQSLKVNDADMFVQSVIFKKTAGATVFAPDSLKKDYFNAVFSNNTGGIGNSTVSIEAAFIDNGLTTTISAVDTPTPINARWKCGEQERILFQDRCTFDSSTDIITSTLEDGTTPFDHGLVADDVLSVHAGNGGVLPGGSVQDQDYFVLADTTSTFQLSETKGGSSVDFSTDGSGIIYYRHKDGDNALSWIISKIIRRH